MSSFFWRNPPQQQVVMGMLRVLREESAPVRILDIGSSYGEMITTYAMLLCEEYGSRWGEDFQITCLEPEPERYRSFRRGIYRKAALYKMPAEFRERWFGHRQIDAAKPNHEIQVLDFSLHEQMRIFPVDFDEWIDPHNDPAWENLQDCIFCQNAMFHMSRAKAEDVIDNAPIILRPGGLFVCAGRHAAHWQHIKNVGFLPVVHDVIKVYESWHCRRALSNPHFALKPYDRADPDLAFKIGSVFRTPAERWSSSGVSW